MHLRHLSTQKVTLVRERSSVVYTYSHENMILENESENAANYREIK